MRLGKLTLLSTFFLLGTFAIASDAHSSNESSRSFIEVEEGPDSVLWIVQLSDLHFSVFHPSRASDFRQLVSPALSTIKPSLVLITGDLTGPSFLYILPFAANRERKGNRFDRFLNKEIFL